MLFFDTSIGVDMHDSLIQFVCLRRSFKKIELLVYGRQNLPDGIVQNGRIIDGEALKQNMITMFEKANPDPISVKEISFVLPSRNVFSHIFKFPAHLSLHDIKKAIYFEAENVIPFSIDDLYWDVTSLERNLAKKDPAEKQTKGDQTVFFAGVQKDIAEEYVHFFEGMGIKPVLFGVHPIVLPEALSTEIDWDGQVQFFIEFDAYGTNYFIFKSGVLKYFLSSSEGSELLLSGIAKSLKMKEVDLMDQWRSGSLKPEILDTLKDFVQKKYHQAKRIVEENESREDIGLITDVYLTGEYASLPQFLEQLKVEFLQKRVHVGDPKRGIVVEDKRFAEQHKKLGGGQVPYSVYLTNAVGVAKQKIFKSGILNLLPDSIKKNFLKEKIWIGMAVVTFVIAMFSVVLGGFMFVKHAQMAGERDRLFVQKTSVSSLLYGTRYQEVKTMLTSFNAEIGQLAKIDQSLFSLPTVLKEVEELVPDKISIYSYSFSDGLLSLNLFGMAKTRDDLLLFGEALETLPFVSKLDAPLSNYDEKEDISFSLVLTFNFSALPLYGGENGGDDS
jgi:Tfp pilus assembly PilM family ATPase